MHCRTVRTACWTILSSRDEIPSGRCSSVGLFDVHPLGRLRPEGSAVNATVKIAMRSSRSCSYSCHAHPVDADGCFLLELIKARSQQFDVDVMKQGGEFELTALAEPPHAHRAARVTFDVPASVSGRG